MAVSNLDHKNDNALLASIQEGDRQAFTVLLKRHTDRFYGLAFRYMADRSEAEDIVQEAFLKLWERPDLWDEGKGSSFSTWFYRVIVNLCLDRQKKHKPMLLPIMPEIKDDAMAQDDILAFKQQTNTLEQEIRALPLRQQTALNLCFYEGLSHQDAASVMCIKIKALQALIARSKVNLKKRMKRVS